MKSKLYLPKSLTDRFPETFPGVYTEWISVSKAWNGVVCTFVPCVILGSGSYKYCAESFLFSLVNPSGSEPTKMPLTGNYNKNGIHCRSEYGPTFGGNHDLYIATGANANSNSYSILGYTYKCPGNGNSSFLVGQRNFSVNEVEVFVFKAS